MRSCHRSTTAAILALTLRKTTTASTIPTLFAALAAKIVVPKVVVAALAAPLELSREQSELLLRLVQQFVDINRVEGHLCSVRLDQDWESALARANALRFQAVVVAEEVHLAAQRLRHRGQLQTVIRPVLHKVLNLPKKG